jgi:oxygen-independent coproporphyrinogen-3 oxidase
LTAVEELPAPVSASLGLYIHVPFCAERCHYCAFNTAPMSAPAMARYHRALAREIDLVAVQPWAAGVTIGSVFFGGGTPSLLAGDELHAIMQSIRQRLGLEADAEVTVECNPESVERAKLAAYRAAGVTRVSLGVQSLDDAILPRLGRLHTAAEARAAFDAARAAGCGNVSVDLMYGLPDLDLATWTRTLEAVLDWHPEHLSAYGLSLDAGSRWGVTGVSGLPAEDAVVAQYWALARAAAARGYEHYEVSNYARPGFRSHHNQTYWRAAEYLGCGPGACGFVGDVRYGNVKPVARYCATLEDGRLPIESAERLTPRQQLAEHLFLGLRTTDGVPMAWLAERLQDDPPLARRVQAWREEALLVETTDGRARLTERGFLVSDALFVELL